MKRRTIFLVLSLVAVCFASWWIAFHGFLDVKITGSGGENNTYALYDKNGGEVQKGAINSDRFKKLVGRGTYQLEIRGANSSWYSIIQTKGFLGTVKVEAKLEPEKSREFVGNNPGFCMHYGQGLLYSYNCSEPGGLAIHLPATQEVPTTTVNETDPPYIPLKGLVNIGGATKAVLVDDEDNNVALYDIDQQLRATNPQRLSSVDGDSVAGISAYGSGFITYNEDLSEINYFSSPSSPPKKIIVPDLPTSNMTPRGITVSGDRIGALFNNAASGNDAGLTENNATGEHLRGKSVFVLYSSANKSYKFNKVYTSGGLCSDTMLCLIGATTLDVYDITGGKARFIFSMKDVQKVIGTKDGPVIAAADKLIRLDPDSLTGSVQYSYGDNQYCGLDETEGGYVLCVVDKKGNKAALHINASQPDTDSIDKKIFALQKSPSISAVSAYKNYVYISPNLGQLVYNNSLGEYGYDPRIIKSTNQKINQLLRDLKIDTGRYTIINPYQ